MKNEILAIIHTIIIILAWLSPFWLDWKLIFFCLILYYVQLLIFKGCVLTNIQFNKNIRKASDMTMYAYWANKFGIKVNKKKLKFESDYIMPAIILIITIVWQILLNIPILIRIW